MITAALEGSLNDVDFEPHQVFGMLMPVHCPGVPSSILNPRNMWNDKKEYDIKACELAMKFKVNFEKYASCVSDEILKAAPVVY